MKQLLLVLALVLFSCKKKDDPKPTPVDPGTITTLQFVCKVGFEAKVSWDGKDSTITSTQTNNDISVKKRIKNNTITLTGRSYRSLPDTTKLRFTVAIPGANPVDVKDTVFTSRTFTLW